MHQLPTNIQSATRILAVAVLSVSLVLTLSLGIFYACDLLVAPVQLRLVSGRSADRVNCKAPAMVDWQMKLPHDLVGKTSSIYAVVLPLNRPHGQELGIDCATNCQHCRSTA